MFIVYSTDSVAATIFRRQGGLRPIYLHGHAGETRIITMRPYSTAGLVPRSPASLWNGHSIEMLYPSASLLAILTTREYGICTQHRNRHARMSPLRQTKWSIAPKVSLFPRWEYNVPVCRPYSITHTQNTSDQSYLRGEILLRRSNHIARQDLLMPDHAQAWVVASHQLVMR